MIGFASIARSDDRSFPVRLFFVKLTIGVSAFGYVSPGLIKAGNLRNSAAGRNWDIATANFLSFHHAEIAIRLRSGLAKSFWR